MFISYIYQSPKPFEISGNVLNANTLLKRFRIMHVLIGYLNCKGKLQRVYFSIFYTENVIMFISENPQRST